MFVCFVLFCLFVCLFSNSHYFDNFFSEGEEEIMSLGQHHSTLQEKRDTQQLSKSFWSMVFFLSHFLLSFFLFPLAFSLPSPSFLSHFLSSGANPDISDKNGRTPLRTSAALGHKEIVSLLLKHGANLEKQHYSGFYFLPFSLFFFQSLFFSISFLTFFSFLLKNRFDSSSFRRPRRTR